MDWPTAFAFVGGAACLVLAISFGGTVYDWNPSILVALWVVTGVLLVSTILLLTFHPGVSKEYRLYPIHFLRKPLLVNMQLQVFLAGGIVLVCFQTHDSVAMTLLTLRIRASLITSLCSSNSSG